MSTVHGKVQYVTVAREVAVGQEGKARLARDPWMEYCKPHQSSVCRMQICVRRNMTVIPLFGDFFLRERQDWQKLRQHDCPSLTPISDAADSQTPATAHWLSTLLRNAHFICAAHKKRTPKNLLFLPFLIHPVPLIPDSSYSSHS